MIDSILKEKYPLHAKEVVVEVNELINACIKRKFSYIHVSSSAWDKLFTNIIVSLSKIDIKYELFLGEISNCVNIAVRNFIKKHLKEGNTYDIDCLLYKLRKNGYKGEVLLTRVIFELDYLGIEFTRDLYYFLKGNSEYFQQLLENLGFSDFEFEKLAIILNEKYELGLKFTYDNMTCDDLERLFGDNYLEVLNAQTDYRRGIFEKFFANKGSERKYPFYDINREINLLVFNKKKVNTRLNNEALVSTYLKHRGKFKDREALYLECYVLGLCDKTEFKRKYPDWGIKALEVINKLEMLYYGIEDLFEYTLSREQYLIVLEKYPEEADSFRKDILDCYYGINMPELSLAELSKKFGTTDEEMRELVKKCRKRCLSLYSNLNLDHKIDRDIYLPYILDLKYDLNSKTREALTLFINGESYKSIAKKTNNKDVATIISKGLQKIDAYRFGIEKIDVKMEENIVLSDDEIKELAILEINRHPSESVIREKDKMFLSYYLGIKCKYNLDGQVLGGSKLQEKLDFKRGVKAKYSDIARKLIQRKIGALTPELIYIEREKLAGILLNPHLPISSEDKKIICSLLELNGYALKSLEDLAVEFGLTTRSLERKYQIALININKYLLGEKEGVIDYECDICPNLRYFTLMERDIINDYYVLKLTNKQLAKKHGLSDGQMTRLMYRIKVLLHDLVNNPNAVRFDYDCYYEGVGDPCFPYNGDILLAKKIFDLYVEENILEKNTLEDVKSKLGLTISVDTMRNIIDGLVLAVFKYKEGIRKENNFSFEEVREFYEQYKEELSANEIALFKAFFDDQSKEISEDIIYLIIRRKFANCLDIRQMSRDEINGFLDLYKGRISKYIEEMIISYNKASFEDEMNDNEKIIVRRILLKLEQSLYKENGEKKKIG